MFHIYTVKSHNWKNYCGLQRFTDQNPGLSAETDQGRLALYLLTLSEKHFFFFLELLDPELFSLIFYLFFLL